MSILYIPREPEPEGMEEEEDVDAYASSAAEQHLDRLDSELVRQLVSTGVREGLALDAGTGPGSIPLKLCLEVSGLSVIGVDVSMPMLRRAREAASAAGVGERLSYVCADVKALPFRDRAFDLVMSNSLLHHLHDPLPCLDEIARVAREKAAVVMKDLRRPQRFLYRLHVAYFGRRYEGRMKSLFEASVRSAFTLGEMRELVSQSSLRGCRTTKWGAPYLVITRPPEDFPAKR